VGAAVLEWLPRHRLDVVLFVVCLAKSAYLIEADGRRCTWGLEGGRGGGLGAR
jgi:hypothetical protein